MRKNLLKLLTLPTLFLPIFSGCSTTQTAQSMRLKYENVQRAVKNYPISKESQQLIKKEQSQLEVTLNSKEPIKIYSASPPIAQHSKAFNPIIKTIYVKQTDYSELFSQRKINEYEEAVVDDLWKKAIVREDSDYEPNFLDKGIAKVERGYKIAKTTYKRGERGFFRRAFSWIPLVGKTLGENTQIAKLNPLEQKVEVSLTLPIKTR